MKQHLTRKAFWQSFLSVITLGVFILLAAGSIGALFLPKSKMEYMGNGIYRETVFSLSSTSRIITGERDPNGRWNGKVTIDWKGKDPYKEEVRMEHGVRQGISTCKYPDGTVEEDHYVNGIAYRFKKAANISTADVTAFQVLDDKYHWFLFSLNAFGFNKAYVQGYMNAVESMLGTYVYDVSKFSDYYGDALDELEETPYDSIITLNTNLTLMQGLEEMKNAEFRLAILNRYRSAGSTTFNIIRTTYPGYLLTLNNKGVNNEDFKVFCQDMDSRMTSYGALNQQDPFFVDSADARMFRAIYSILNTGKSLSPSEESSVKSIPLFYKNLDINDIYDEVLSLLKPSDSKSTPKEVGTIVVNDMLEQYYVPAEIIRQAVMEAYFIKGGVKRIPVATTVFESNNSATSATLKGYVIEDGGAAVTSRGIAWATFYAPTTTANMVNSGTGTGNFQVTLNALTPGTTYYARTFATNSAGTAYGNTVSFVASIATDVNDIKILNHDFNIYPNPASSLTTFSFLVESTENIMLTIIDMKGKVVLKKELGSLSQGENQVMLNLSLLKNGMYICQLTKGTIKATRKLVIFY